jgi:SAM-dependent methyltransferase
MAVDRCDDNFSLFKSKYAFPTFKCDIEKDKLDLKDNSADAVMCFHLIEHLLNPDSFMNEIRRALKPGGKFFIVTPDWRKQYKTFYRDPTHVRPYDKESIARLLSIYSFEASVHSWGSAYGLGRLKAYIAAPRLGMIGQDILAIGTKK